MVALVGALVLVALFATSGRDQPDEAGLRPAPAIDVERLDEPGRIRLADYRGTPVIVTFWASWCTPCRQEMPELDAIAKKHGSRLAVIGVNMDDRPEDARALLAALGVGYPVGIDADGTAVRTYDVSVVPRASSSPQTAVSRAERAANRHQPSSTN